MNLPPVRILVATPILGTPEAGSVTSAYMNAAMRVLGGGMPVEWIMHAAFVNMDLARARSRAVRIALDGCFTHLLFWDSDVGGDAVSALAAMVAAKADVIAAPYPRKRIPIQGTHARPFVAMGFTLISTTCLERMWDAYYDELQFDDVLEQKPYRTVALFQLMFVDVKKPRPHRAFLGEDYSFCERWLRLGGDIHVLNGHTMDHVGNMRYSGTAEELAP